MSELKIVTDFNNNCINNFTNFLNVFFNEDKIELFKELLKSQKAIISGGSIVRSLFDSPKNWISDDIDIYVNAKNCIPLRNFLLQECTSFEIPKPLDDKGKVKKGNHTYTQSLFKRSKIIKIIRFNMFQNNITIQPYNPDLHIDLMIVSNSVNLPEVVDKFDLTCCKVFYDGVEQTIKGYHIEETIQYKAQLGKYFVPALLNGKKKIQERLEKYKSRGFEITIDMPQTHVYGSYVKTENVVTEPLSMEDKLKKKFYNLIYSIIFGTIYRKNIKLAKNCNLGLNSIIPLPSEEATKMCVSPKNKNRIWSAYSESYASLKQRYEYQDDGYDREDFNSLEDYIFAGKEIEYNSVIEHLKNRYISIYRLFNNMEDEEVEEEIYINNYHRSNEKMQYFCKNELPVFLKLMNVDISKLNSKYDNSEFIEILPEDLECFVETEQDDFKIKEFLKNINNIVVRSGENLKGYNRTEIIKYIRKKESFFTGEKISKFDINKLKDKTYQIYDMVNTGLSYNVIIPHKNLIFLKNEK